MGIIDVEATVEKQILIGLIVETDFLKRMYEIIEPDLFEMEASKTVWKWIKGYFEKYGKAPNRDLEHLFLDKVKGMPEEQQEWLSSFLEVLSEDYEKIAINQSYLFDKALNFFRKRKLAMTAEQILALVEDDKIDEASALMTKDYRLPGDLDLGMDVLDYDSVDWVFRKENRFSMDFGIKSLDLIAGPQKSEWLIMFMGPMKRGKTLVLFSIATRAVLKGLNTVVINLESGYEDLLERSWMNIGALASQASSPDDIKIPYFIKKDEIKYNKKKPVYVDEKENVIKTIAKFKKYAMGKLRVKSFPAFSATMEDLESYLDSLETYHFTPHVVVIDYLGALDSPRRGVSGRDIYDQNSKLMKALSQKRKCIVFSAHQGSRATLEKMTLHPTDVPEDVRILGNVDIMYGLNQTDEEREKGVIRVNVLMHRFRKWNRLKQSMILQQPEIGQFHLDNRLVYFKDGGQVKPLKMKKKQSGEDERG